ncbi:MAG: NAD(P)H-hydrate dehydratase [Planctomycetota bacterium]
MQRVVHVPTLPPRAAEGHKGSYGTVLIVAGSAGMLGAAILAARGALRGGAGLVRACVPAELRGAFTAAVPAATTLARDGTPATWLDGATVAVLGPGLGTGPAAVALVEELVHVASIPLVLDADALNVLAPLSAPLGTTAPVVLTPHPGEAGRLLGASASAVNADRSAAAAALVGRAGGARGAGRIVVLKGANTVVCDGGREFVNDTGNPGMATGGSGDVLAGLLGAMLAQGLSPFDAACLGVHVHGAAADRVAARLSQCGLIAEDLPLAIAEVLRP